MISSDDINSLVDDAIIQLCSDNINEGVDCLVELARVFAQAGCGIQSFLNMRKFIIQQAVEKTDAYFIETKVQLAEKQMRNSRDGRNIIH